MLAEQPPHKAPFRVKACGLTTLRSFCAATISKFRTSLGAIRPQPSSPTCEMLVRAEGPVGLPTAECQNVETFSAGPGRRAVARTHGSAAAAPRPTKSLPNLRCKRRAKRLRQLPAPAGEFPDCLDQTTPLLTACKQALRKFLHILRLTNSSRPEHC